ncbi:hypothetical protein F5J12DRAFT_905565 [Pisolithus orientalis]|uniref:uncharacterized protein n=1 Tax=Pisolithus orientalis TaxID=936130 RepID=UPI00222558B0|nr:uncharacterized protein F5J12DRAFT_905565 [Pisolithus orientalis]KAI6007711.1 hypothetical protein F5J12DRAFT_905565 [Pisolithus orientalis]
MGLSLHAHPSPYRVVHNASHPRIQYPQGVPSTKPPSVPRQDEYYGHADTSLLCTRFITHLFACPELPPSSSNSKVKLQKFIAYALHRTKLQPSVTFAALVLLQRLKARFPTARGSSGHRLFISAFMLASKVICDDTYSNKSWGIVAQGMFQLREINQMEREMCQYLEWELNVDPSTLCEFETMVRRDFVGMGPFPTYVLPSTKKSTPPPSTNPFAPQHSNFIPPPPHAAHRHPSPPRSAYVPPPSYSTPPDTPEASPSYSTSSTSPASSAPPPTPVGVEDLSAKIVSASSSPGYSSMEHTKMFAFASPAVW